LRLSAFLGEDQLASQLVGYLKQKTNQLENEEFVQLFSSLVLVRLSDPKYLKLVESLSLRKAHSFSSKQLTSVLVSYSHLVRQRKLKASLSFIRTWEYLVTNKQQEFSADDLAHCLSGFAKMGKEQINEETFNQLLSAVVNDLEGTKSVGVAAELFNDLGQLTVRNLNNEDSSWTRKVDMHLRIFSRIENLRKPEMRLTSLLGVTRKN